MANIEITEKTKLLGNIINDVQEIYIVAEVCKNAAAVSAIAKMTELPVIEDSIEVDLGSVDAAYTKVTDGTIVASKFSKGDPSCTLNVATIDAEANAFFAKAIGTKASVSLGGKTYSLQGYEGKTFTLPATIVMVAADHMSMIAFPNCRVSGSLKPTGGGDANTGYWEVTFVPLMNEDGAQFYLSDGSEAAGE